MERTSVFNRRAAFGGAATTLISAGMGLVIALALGALLDWTRGQKSMVASLFAIAGFLLGGFRAGLLEPKAPLTNGAAAAAIGYVPLGIVQRIGADKDIRILTILSAAFFAAACGVFGGFVANNANSARGPRS